jgi:hypothetical protein
VVLGCQFDELSTCHDKQRIGHDHKRPALVLCYLGKTGWELVHVRNRDRHRHPERFRGGGQSLKPPGGHSHAEEKLAPAGEDLGASRSHPW